MDDIEELLPYLYKTVYESSDVWNIYGYENMLKDIEHIPIKKEVEVVKFCLKHRLMVHMISYIFRDIERLESFGKDYSTDKYDKYYTKFTNHFEALKSLTDDPETLANVEPIEKPSTSIYKLIHTNENIRKNYTDILSIFDKNKVRHNTNIDTEIKIENDKMMEELEEYLKSRNSRNGIGF
jgi:hypothetical protein